MRLLSGEKSLNKSVTLTPRLLVWCKIFSVKIVFTAWESKLRRWFSCAPKIRSLICAYWVERNPNTKEAFRLRLKSARLYVLIEW